MLENATFWQIGVVFPGSCLKTGFFLTWMRSGKLYYKIIFQELLQNSHIWTKRRRFPRPLLEERKERLVSGEQKKKKKKKKKKKSIEMFPSALRS